jgi:hypothetical protein
MALARLGGGRAGSGGMRGGADQTATGKLKACRADGCATSHRPQSRGVSDHRSWWGEYARGKPSNPVLAGRCAIAGAAPVKLRCRPRRAHRVATIVASGPAANPAATGRRPVRGVSRSSRAARAMVQHVGQPARVGAPSQRSDHEANAPLPQAPPRGRRRLGHNRTSINEVTCETGSGVLRDSVPRGRKGPPCDQPPRISRSRRHCRFSVACRRKGRVR